MSLSWRASILDEFTPQVARLTLVADPDGLLLEEGVLEGIRKRGFELIPFEDPVEFRFAYESRFRSRWDRGEVTDLVVVLRADQQDLNSLPFDLLQAGRKLAFSLGELFPNLSYPVIDALDRSHLDALYRAQARHSPGTLGDNATKDFVLRHVFEIAPELIKQPSDLLRMLLRRHFTNQRIPAVLDERLILVLQHSGLFDEWPLEFIVPDKDSFFEFLQERWPGYLDRLACAAKGDKPEDAVGQCLKHAGPVDLPFDHDDIRVYIDDLFAEGLLKPVNHPQAAKMAETWAAAGVILDPQGDRVRRLEALLSAVGTSLPDADARHYDWFPLAYRWAEILVLRHDIGRNLPSEISSRLQELQNGLDGAFEI